MRIKRVDISGFKSFCDHTQIAFNNAVTAVVGPNGCGKSNILDSIRWALGEQSARTLRGRAMEDVIFAGSESRGPQSFAEVVITFDNSDGLSHPNYLDYPEISVTRRLHRDGTSEYLVNKVPCRLMDVTDLFLGTGGGARAYSIIEQGRIGLIVSARSEDRRNMIEEAAGITKYKSARRTAERRMEQTRQNLLRVTDIVGEMERNLAGLKRQANKAERYKRYRAEQTDLELYLASHRYLELRARSVAAAHARAAEEESLATARDALGALEARTESLKLEEQSARARLDEATAVGYEINNEVQVIESELRHLGDAVARHLADERTAGEELAAAMEQRARLADEASLIRAQLERATESRDVIGVRCLELGEQADAARARLEEIGAEHDERRDRVSLLRARLAAAESAVASFGRRIEEGAARLGNARGELDSVADRAAELEQHATSLTERTSWVETLLRGARSTEEREREVYAVLKGDIEACDEERRSVRDELAAKSSRLASLKEVMDGLETHDRAVREAVKLIENEGAGLLDGLLVDAVSCPEHLEPALAAALNDRLQALLVRNRESGLALLALLKERDMGRVTVLPTSGANEAEPTPLAIGEPGAMRPLVELLEIAAAVAPLVRELLRDVYVVESLAAAEALFEASGGKASFVTLDGQLLEAGGAMRGGRTLSAGASLLGQKRQIRELSADVEVLEARHEVLEQRFQALKREIAERGEASERARSEAQAQEVALAEARKDQHRAVDDLESLKERRQAMAREVAHQEEMLAKAEEDRTRAREEAEAVRLEIEDLEQILADQLIVIEARRQEVDRAAAAFADARVQQAALEQQWQSACERQEQIGRGESELGERLARAEEKRARLADAIGATAGRVFCEKERLGEKLDEAEVIRVRIEELRRELDAATSRSAEAEEETKGRRKRIEEIASAVSARQLEERELDLETGHLIESVIERTDKDVRRVIGDYHLRPIPGEDVRARVDDLRQLVERMGPINLAAIEEFEAESKRHADLVTQKADLEQALADLEKAIARMDKDSKRRFAETFEDVNRRFQEIFPRLFNGGRAHLQLTDPEDMLATGVDIVAQPPGKRLGNIELMSGGEKALTAVSLLFAIFLHRPSPFCVLDEVDAPLDEANIGRFIDMVRQMTDRSQFIIITHSKLTMERSDALYGVTMEEPGVSKLVTVRFSDHTRALAANE